MKAMRSQAVTLILVLVGCCCLAERSAAQIEVSLFSITNTWRYNAWGTNVPTTPVSWTPADYDDSWWLAGQALFGSETTPEIYSIPFTTPIPATSAGGPHTAYFRTHFDLPSNSAAGLILRASCLLDDGAVFYVNGAEVQRVRMPTGAISYNTFALRGPPTEGGYETFSFSATNVHQGDNVLAAELHQVNSTDSDTAFALLLTAVISTPIVITNDLPAEITAEEGKPLTLSVGVQGSDPSYRWFRNNFSVGVTTPAFTFSPNTNVQGAQYKVVVTNVLNKVTSSVAVVTVRQDLYPPGLISAIAQDSASSNTIVVTFTENPHPATANNPTNYALTQPGSAESLRISTSVSSGNQVTLTVSDPLWTWGQDYVLTVTNVADFRGNYMAPPTNRIMVAFPEYWLNDDDELLYWDWVGAAYYRTPPVCLPADWTQPDLDDTDRDLWRAGPGMMYYDWDPLSYACGRPTTPIPTTVSGVKTHYFRAHFPVPAGLANGEATLQASVMDGAVFYLNGTEISRFNMPAGPVTPETAALMHYDHLDCVGVAAIAANQFRAGNNILAVEVHRSPPTPGEVQPVYLGLRIRAVIPRPLP